MEFRRTLACTLVALACIFAGFLSGKVNYCAYAHQRLSNPERSLILALVNNACDDEDAERPQNKPPPHWYASPEWWLVIVAVPSIVLIWYQARETARAARAAEANIQIIISKERARLWVEPSREMADMQRGLMPFKVCFSGSTDAIVKESGTYAVVTRSEEPPPLPKHIPQIPLPKIITPTTEPHLHYANVMGEVPPQPGIAEGKLFLHLAGFIRYTDVFQDKAWERKFRYLWVSSKIHGIAGQWIEWGKTEENQETQPN